MTTVLNALQNAEANLQTLGKMGLSSNPLFRHALKQLQNGIAALENGMAPDDVLQAHLGADVITTKEAK